MKQNAETAVERFSCFGSVLAYFHCAGASSVELHLRHNRTDARNRIWCILALKCDTWLV